MHGSLWLVRTVKTTCQRRYWSRDAGGEALRQRSTYGAVVVSNLANATPEPSDGVDYEIGRCSRQQREAHSSATNL